MRSAPRTRSTPDRESIACIGVGVFRWPAWVWTDTSFASTRAARAMEAAAETPISNSSSLAHASVSRSRTWIQHLITRLGGSVSSSDSSSGKSPSVHQLVSTTFHCSRYGRAPRSGYFAMILTGRSLTGVPSTITVTSSRTEITPIRMKVSRKVLLCLRNSASLKLTSIHMNPRTKTIDNRQRKK